MKELLAGRVYIVEIRVLLTRVESTTDNRVFTGAEFLAADELYEAAFPRAGLTSEDESYDGAGGGDPRPPS